MAAVDRLGILGLYLFFPPLVSVVVALVLGFSDYVSMDPKESRRDQELRTELIMKDKYEDISSRLKIGAAIGLAIGLFVAYRCHMGERERARREDRDQP